MTRMTPAAYGRYLASLRDDPLTPEQIEAAARILASVEPREEDRCSTP